MKSLSAITINKLDVELTYGGDLIFYEGPLLTHYSNPRDPNEHFFYKWVDSDDIHHRWMIFKITVDDLLLFFDGNWTLLDLIRINPFCYFVDIADNLKIERRFICSTEAIPEDYLPSATSIFDANHYEAYAGELKEMLTQRKKNTDLSNFIADIKNDIGLKNFLERLIRTAVTPSFKEELTKQSFSDSYHSEDSVYSSKAILNTMSTYGTQQNTGRATSI